MVFVHSVNECKKKHLFYIQYDYVHFFIFMWTEICSFDFLYDYVNGIWKKQHATYTMRAAPIYMARLFLRDLSDDLLNMTSTST